MKSPFVSAGQRLDWLEDLARRFLGVDVQYRRSTNNRSGENDWPHPWRVRIVTSKNERAEYRITVYGATIEVAIEALYAEVAKVDAP